MHAATHSEERHQRLELGSQLHLAVEREELVVLYLPQVDLRALAVVGVEALVRWNRPTRGLLAPDAFLAMAEGSGIIVDITTGCVAMHWPDFPSCGGGAADEPAHASARSGR